MKFRRRRWLVILGLGLASALGWVRLVQALSSWQLLVSYGAGPGPLWMTIMGGVGGAAGIVAVLGLLLHRTWALRWARGYVLGLALITWVERLLFSRSAAVWSGWSGELAFTLLLAGTALWLLQSKNYPPPAVTANCKNQ